jgi:type IV secretory pathway VirB4 component
MLADRGQPLSSEEGAVLDLALVATYRRAGFLSDPRTHRHERTPLLGDLLEVLRDPEQYLSGVDRQLVRSLATRLARYVEGSLADLFSGPTNVRLDNPLTVFNVAGLSESLRALGIHLISNFVWTKVRRDHVLGRRRPLQLVVDELWWTLRSPEGGQFLDLMARKARKYWLGLVCASQSPADCLESQYGPAIVNNSRTWVLLGMVSKALEAARSVMKLTEREVAILSTPSPARRSCCAACSRSRRGCS